MECIIRTMESACILSTSDRKNQQEQKHDQISKDGNSKQRHIMCKETYWWFPVMTTALAAGGSKARNLITSDDHNHSSGMAVIIVFIFICC
jgi:hypothetical protein